MSKTPNWLLPAAAIGLGAFVLVQATKSKAAPKELLPNPPASPDLALPDELIWRSIDGALKGRPDILDNVQKLMDKAVPNTLSSQLTKIVGQATTLNRLPEGISEPGTNRSWTMMLDQLVNSVNNVHILEKWLVQMRKFGLPLSVYAVEQKVKQLRGV